MSKHFSSKYKKQLLIITASALFIALGLLIYAILPGGSISTPVEANPDYICIKQVNGQACEANSCTDWTNGSRTCFWTVKTEIAYINTRSTCEPGYGSWDQNTCITKGYRWAWSGENGGGCALPGDSEGNNAARWLDNNSGRKTGDYTLSSESCTVVQTDTTPPIANPITQ